jgi:hypothetical protein
MTTKSPEIFLQRSDSSMTKKTKMLPIPAVKKATAMLKVAMTIVTAMMRHSALKIATAMLLVAMTRMAVRMRKMRMAPTMSVMQIARTVRTSVMLIARTVRTPGMLIAKVVLIVRKRTIMMMFNSLKSPAVKTKLLKNPTFVLISHANYVKIAHKKKKREREAVIVVVRPTVMLKVWKKTRVMMIISLRPSSVNLKLTGIYPLRKLLNPSLPSQPLQRQLLNPSLPRQPLW